MAADKEQIEKLANKVIQLAHDDLLMHLRFFDIALAKLSFQTMDTLEDVASSIDYFYYSPTGVLRRYKEEVKWPARAYLHMMLHAVFFHPFGYEKLQKGLWNICADIAVENVILEMDLPSVAMKNDGDLRRKLAVLKEDVGTITADKLYKYFQLNPMTFERMQEYQKLFARDAHDLWNTPEQMEISLEQWRKISERVKTDLKSFAGNRAGNQELLDNLSEATKERYDYGAILRRFMTVGEDLCVNDDEFDYVYYTYGLRTYGNLPLVEPLEYKEIHKVKEFVIAIDTSASCRGSVVREFIKKTYQILKSSENFFHKINVHIIQCDNQIQEDIKITNEDEFQAFLKNGKLSGFGSTDFRPVFDYVDELIEKKEFENLKGLIYFTDGYGIYPERLPQYDVIFAFLEEDKYRAPVPSWSMKVVLEEEKLMGDAMDSEGEVQ